MTGGEMWSFGEIPLQVDTVEGEEGAGGGLVFPALVDEGATVGMRAFLEEEEAMESHRAGCVRLFLLEQEEQVECVRKQFPMYPTTRLYASMLSHGGELVDELLR